MERVIPGIKRLGAAAGRAAFLGFSLAASVNAFAEVDFESGPLEFSVDAEVAHPFSDDGMSGNTSLEVPPLGSVTLDTHDGPLDVNARLVNIDPDELESYSRDPEVKINDFSTVLRRDIEEAKSDLVQQTVLSVMGGFIVGSAGIVAYDSFRRNISKTESIKKTIAPIVAMGMLVGGVGVYGLQSRNPNALHEAEYEGVLARTPEVIGNVYDISDRFNEQTAQLADTVSYLSELIYSYDNLLVLPSDTINVLLVADRHCQPGTDDIIARTVAQYNAALVLDAGDITDHGSEIENTCFDEIGSLPVPYVYVGGNHDSGITRQAMNDIENVVELQGQAEEIGGLTILGSHDPRFTPDLSSPRQDAELLSSQSLGLRQAIERSETASDIVVAHDPDAAQYIYGLVPLIVSGHLHRYEYATEDETLHITNGTIGGGGLRAFENGDATPRTATILSFDADTKDLTRVVELNFGAIDELSSSTRVCEVIENSIEC